MARPPLQLGTWGSIKRRQVAKSQWTAYARFRDYDGVTRQVKRDGRTGAEAERLLIAVLVDRNHLPTEDLTRDSPIRLLAERWLAEYVEGDRSGTTKTAYQEAIKRHINPAMGEVRLWEATVPYLDRYVKAVTRNSGPGASKRVKVVLSHMFALAARHGALPSNPMRDTGRIPEKRKVVRAMGVADVRGLRTRLAEYDAGNFKHNHPRNTDLADPVDMLLATGARTGELFALRWSDIDLEAAPPTAHIHGTVVFQKGRGYYIQDHPKTDDSRRNLKLPPFAVDMLRRRKKTAVTEMVFPSARLSLRIPNNFRRQWRDFREFYGYESWIVPKTFRKAVATLLSEQGGVQLASDQLGHANTDVTRQHYVERSSEGPDATKLLEQFAG